MPVQIVTGLHNNHFSERLNFYQILIKKVSKFGIGKKQEKGILHVLEKSL